MCCFQENHEKSVVLNICLNFENNLNERCSYEYRNVGFIDGWMHKKNKIPSVVMCHQLQNIGLESFGLVSETSRNENGIHSSRQTCLCFPNQFDKLLHKIMQFRFCTSPTSVGLRKLSDIREAQTFFGLT